MEDSNSNGDFNNDENRYLDKIIQSSLKKLKSSTKTTKGAYKLNLFADLIESDGISLEHHRLS